MSVKVIKVRTFTCNGQTGCERTFVGTDSAKVLREGYKRMGWRSHPQGNYDLCPECSETFLKEHNEEVRAN